MTNSPIDFARASEEPWLKLYYFIRAAFSVVWVAAAFTAGQHSPALATILLVVYPAWDAAANYLDATRSGGLGRAAVRDHNGRDLDDLGAGAAADAVGTPPMKALLNLSAWVIYAALLLPVLIVAGASFTGGGYLRFPPDGLSLRWWQVMIEDPDMTTGFLVSARIALLTVMLSVPIGALAAIQLSRLGPRWRNAWATVLTAPLSVPLILTGFSMLVFFTQVGLLNEFGLVIGHTVVAVPYVLRSALASMSLADHSLPRAAAIHGARPWQVVRHVILPMMRPGLVSGGMFAFLASVNNIVISVFIAQPGDSPLPVVIFSRMENLAEPSVAAASTAVIVLTAILCLLLERRYALFRSLAGR